MASNPRRPTNNERRCLIFRISLRPSPASLVMPALSLDLQEGARLAGGVLADDLSQAGGEEMLYE
jgi:hypothetical protein